MAVTNRRGIFSLLDVRERQGAGVWSTKGDVWNTPSPFLVSQGFATGYFAGGYGPTLSLVDRVDYSNDTATASVKGPISVKYVMGATSAAANALPQ